MTWRLFVDDERFPSSKDYDMIIACAMDEVKNLVSDLGMPSFVLFDPNETYYAITAKGRDYYEACTGHVVDDLLFEEDVCYA